MYNVMYHIAQLMWCITKNNKLREEIYMKKSLIALAIAAFASSAVSAATVYDKDGTTFAIGGRVQSVFYSGQFGTAGNNDSSIVNTGRLNISGRSQIAPGITAFGFAEWNTADGDNGGNGDTMQARDQYIGVDFGKYGAISAGRSYDALYAVVGVTDIYEDLGANGIFDDSDRRAGNLKYVWEGYGVYAAASFQSAKNDIAVEGANEKGVMNVDHGFSGVLGYTTPSVLFGPISVKAGYTYLAGQNDADYSKTYDIDNMKEWAASVTWGSLDTGLYLAAVYDQRKFDYIYSNTARAANHSLKGIEALIGYGFDNGLSVIASWQYQRLNAQSKDNSYIEAEKIIRKVPILVNYAFNPNFNVYLEASFDMGSDDQLNYKNTQVSFKDETNADHTLFAVGARYTF